MNQQRRDWGESAVLLVCISFYLIFPNRYTIAGPEVTTALGIAVAVIFVLSVFWTIFGWSKGARRIMATAAVLLSCVVITTLVKLIYLAFFQTSNIDGTRLLATAVMIWIANVAIFAIVYHLIGDGEFLFPKKPGDADKPMRFMDYVYLSFSTSTAFSATDIAPLTTRARMFMMIEAGVSLTTVAIAAARAINLIK